MGVSGHWENTNQFNATEFSIPHIVFSSNWGTSNTSNIDILLQWNSCECVLCELVCECVYWKYGCMRVWDTGWFSVSMLLLLSYVYILNYDYCYFSLEMSHLLLKLLRWWCRLACAADQFLAVRFLQHPSESATNIIQNNDANDDKYDSQYQKFSKSVP